MLFGASPRFLMVGPRTGIWCLYGSMQCALQLFYYWFAALLQLFYYWFATLLPLLLGLWLAAPTVSIVGWQRGCPCCCGYDYVVPTVSVVGWQHGCTRCTVLFMASPSSFSGTLPQRESETAGLTDVVNISKCKYTYWRKENSWYFKLRWSFIVFTRVDGVWRCIEIRTCGKSTKQLELTWTMITIANWFFKCDLSRAESKTKMEQRSKKHKLIPRINNKHQNTVERSTSHE